MIEEKIREPEQQAPSAPQRPSSGKEKLLSLWARIELIGVLRRHHIRKWIAAGLSRIFRLLTSNPMAHKLGGALYGLGFSGEYALVRLGRILMAAALRVGRTLWRELSNLEEMAFPEVLLVLKELFGPFYVFFRGMRNLYIHGRNVRRERGFAAGLRESAAYLGRGFLRYVGLLPRTAAYLLPLCALGLLVGVVRYVVSQPYTLAVQVDGVTVGYVENETVFDSAREAVLERINYAGASQTEWTIEPTYTLAVADDTMDQNQMADTILRTASDEIGEGTALYLDGELTAICADGAQLSAYLDSLLAPYENPEDPTQTVSFNREVTLEEGIYFNESFKTYDEIVNTLSGVRQEQRNYTVVEGDSISLIASKNDLTVAELCALNTDIGLSIDSAIFPGDSLIVTGEEAMLEVRITRQVTWEEEIPFTTEKTSSSDYAFGTTRTIQEGEAGIRSITAQNVYDAEGVLLEQQILSTEVVKEPVTRKIVTGTKLPSGSIAQVGNGTFIWPVPQYTSCSRWYSSTHKGVDICAPAGTPIYASSSGVVSKAGYERAGAGTGYGNSIIINHGNGYSTLYSHCLSLTVSAGQAVSQGQLIGYVGSTGRSTGNHCHFEIRYNGKYLPPQNYFNK